MRAEVAFVFHFPPSELAAMTLAQLTHWHGQAVRIRRDIYS